MFSKQSVEKIAAHEKTAYDFLQQDMRAKNDLLEAQVWLAQEEQDLECAEQPVAHARAVLNTLLHKDVNTAMEIVNTSDEQKVALTLFDSQARAMQHHPVIRESTPLFIRHRLEYSLHRAVIFQRFSGFRPAFVRAIKQTCGELHMGALKHGMLV